MRSLGYSVKREAPWLKVFKSGSMITSTVPFEKDRSH